jgi:hypothetical protein
MELKKEEIFFLLFLSSFLAKDYATITGAVTAKSNGKL